MLEFFDTIEYVNINQATIDITIDEPRHNEITPSSVSFYYTDESNKRILSAGEYLGIYEEGSYDLLKASFNEDELNYQGAITLFSDNLIKGYIGDTTVLMYPPDFGILNTVNQFAVSPGKIKLEIYYSRIK